MSPMADGPLKFSGNLSNNMNIEKITRFGRTFSVLRIPYSFKLLMQELQVMNINMRVITEDNVDQLSSMNFSDNANLLAGIDNIENVISNVDASIIVTAHDEFKKLEIDIFLKMLNNSIKL